jgi:hypothetical protein
MYIRMYDAYVCMYVCMYAYICYIYLHRYADTEGATIESEELQKWVFDTHPRSRTEAYPLYLLTKDVLKRVATDKCLVINTTLSNLRAELARQAEAMAQGEHAAEQVRQQLLSQIQDLEQALQDEVKKPKGGSAEDMARLAQSDETIEDMKRRLDTAVKDSSKATELAEKAKKDTEMYKKEHNTVTKLQQDTAMKLKRAEAAIASLQSGAGQDPLDSMTDDMKCVVLKRLLTDEGIFKTKSFTQAVASGLEAPAPKGCPNSVKRTITSRLLMLLCEVERTVEGGTSALAMVSRLISKEGQSQPPGTLTVYDLIQECVIKEVVFAPMEVQAALVKFLAETWFNDFESARSSLNKVATEFVSSCGSSTDSITRDQITEGLAALGVTGVGVTSFLKTAAGGRWLSMRIKATLLRKDQGNFDEAKALEDSFTVSLSDIRRALQPGGAYSYLVIIDVRQAALNEIFRKSLDRELGGHGVGQYLTAGAKIEDSQMQGYPDEISVLADLLQVDRTSVMLEFARKMPGEAMALEHQDCSVTSNKQRRSMLRYATAIVGHEKHAFGAWREELEISKQERKEDGEKQKTEEARQRKMKKPGTRNMSMYDGGKPTAVKTLGAQIGSIFEGKVVSDELMDKTGRPRDSMPEFLKNFFIRQYGLKSIAVKNLANLAAGIRKEEASNLRLHLFGVLSGIIEPEKFVDGKCDMLLAGIKALFPVGMLTRIGLFCYLIGLFLGHTLFEGVKALFW